MFSAFRTLGFHEVGVHLSAFHVTAGAADETMLDDWKVRFAALEPVGLTAFGSPAAWKAFTSEYLATLGNPDALKYSVVLTTVGTRP